jgi:hypothetical protein
VHTVWELDACKPVVEGGCVFDFSAASLFCAYVISFLRCVVLAGLTRFENWEVCVCVWKCAPTPVGVRGWV